MNILQYRFTKITDKEAKLFEDFGYWLCAQMFEYLNNKLNRRKIYLKLSYLYKVPWIQWKNKKELDVDEVMQAIKESFEVKQCKDNLWKIYININIKIPNTYTSIGRLIRFLNYGDLNNKGTGMFTELQFKFKHKKLNSLWKIFTLHRQGRYSNIKIIAE